MTSTLAFEVILVGHLSVLTEFVLRPAVIMSPDV